MKGKIAVFLVVIILLFLFETPSIACENALLTKNSHVPGSPATITALCADSRNNIFVGTSNKGLYCYSKKSWTKLTGVSFTAIRSMVCDPEDNIWVGTASGLNKITITDKSGIESTNENKDFSGFEIQKFFADSGMNDNIVQALAVNKKNIFIGTTKGCYIADFEGSEVEKLTTKHGLPSNIINALFAYDDGTLYIGTPAGIVSYYQGTLQNYELENENEWVTAIGGWEVRGAMKKKMSKTLKKILMMLKYIAASLSSRPKIQIPIGKCSPGSQNTNSPPVNDIHSDSSDCEMRLETNEEYNIRIGRLSSEVNSVIQMISPEGTLSKKSIYVGTNQGCYNIIEDFPWKKNDYWTTAIGVSADHRIWSGARGGLLKDVASTGGLKKKDLFLPIGKDDYSEVKGITFDNSYMWVGVYGSGLFRINRLKNHSDK